MRIGVDKKWFTESDAGAPGKGTQPTLGWGELGTAGSLWGPTRKQFALVDQPMVNQQETIDHNGWSIVLKPWSTIMINHHDQSSWSTIYYRRWTCIPITTLKASYSSLSTIVHHKFSRSSLLRRLRSAAAVPDLRLPLVSFSGWWINSTADGESNVSIRLKNGSLMVEMLNINHGS